MMILKPSTCKALKVLTLTSGLFQIDLLDYNSIVAAVVGCAGVFHLTSPCIIDRVQDPQKELLNPAIKGTINVLTEAKEAGVSRVVLTSSISSITPSPKWPYDVIKNEDSLDRYRILQGKPTLNCCGPIMVSDVKNIS
ncbi:hypothetical protein K1719_032157 [Acacia pycnantha]|nr:hypothetical protein K1719_032157 [Acacia pycnantha]